MTVMLPLPLDMVADSTLIAEIIMKPEKTAWLTDAEKRGLATHYGRHMLDFQVELIGKFIGALALWIDHFRLRRKGIGFIAGARQEVN